MHWWVWIRLFAVGFYQLFIYFAELVLYNMGGPKPTGLERWTGDRVVLSSDPAVETLLRNFGNSVYPTLPVSFRWNTKSRRALLSGVYDSMPGEVKDPTNLHWKCVTSRGLHILA